MVTRRASSPIKVSRVRVRSGGDGDDLPIDSPMASSSAMVTVVAVVVSTGVDIDGFTSVAPMSRDGHAS